jgi:hypothetical protein
MKVADKWSEERRSLQTEEIFLHSKSQSNKRGKLRRYRQ